jgi:hypothetical protein
MSKKWYTDKTGKTSAMRIIAMLSTCTGCIGLLFGGVLVLLGHSEGAQIAVAGAGMAGLAEVSKAWQASK